MLADVTVEARPNQIGAQLAVGGGHRQDLVATGLDGTGLVRGDVAAGRCDHRFVRTQEGSQRDQVGLRAAGEKMHVCVTTKPIADQRGGTFAVQIQAIATIHFSARHGQRLQEARVRAFAVVVAQVDSCRLGDHVHHNPFAASATARNSARPLFIVSSHSFSGSES